MEFLSLNYWIGISIVSVIIGLIMLVKSIRRPPQLHGCSHCGYSMRGHAAGKSRCPECGSEMWVVPNAPQPAYRFSAWRFALGMLLVFAPPAVWMLLMYLLFVNPPRC